MLRLLKNELYKTVRQKKFYLFAAIITAVEITIILQYKLKGGASGSLHLNGQSFPMALFNIFSQMMMILIAVSLADTVVEEYRSGAFKLSLLRPVNRIDVLNAKIISLLIFMTSFMLYAILSSYIVGVLSFGWGDQFIVNGAVNPAGNGVVLTFRSALLSLLPELGFGMLVTFIAFLSENIAATIGFSLGFMVAAPYIEYINGFKDYFITHQVNGFYQDVLKGFSRSDVFTDIVTIAAYLIVFYSGSMLVLKRKDILL